MAAGVLPAPIQGREGELEARLIQVREAASVARKVSHHSGGRPRPNWKESDGAAESLESELKVDPIRDSGVWKALSSFLNLHCRIRPLATASFVYAAWS